MRECPACHTAVQEHVRICPQCHGELTPRSDAAESLHKLMISPRVTGIYIAAPTYACPVCRTSQGTYYKTAEIIPTLPHEGCSCPNGCVCLYEPLVSEVGP